MSTPHAPAPPVRSTRLFSILQQGRERKLGRPLHPEELLQLERDAAGASAAGVSTVQERPSLHAARAAVAALPKALTALPPPTARSRATHSFPLPQRRRRRASARLCASVIADATEKIQQAIRDGRVRPGPNLPPFAMRSSAIYVQQEDLESLVPDGWGSQWPLQASRLARSHGLPPLALPLLCLLEWAAAFRPPLPVAKDRHECGAGFQVSLDWLARKLGCSRVWVQALMNRLDPFAHWRREAISTKRLNRKRAANGQSPLASPPKPPGTPLIHRFRRLKRYETSCDEGARARVWVDRSARPHLYLDVRGVCYLTSAGRAVLLRQSRAPANDVDSRTRRVRHFISARLRRGHAVLSGGHGAEVLETRRELAAAPAWPPDLSPRNQLPIAPTKN